MNILITGGAGYVGSIVSEELLKEGHKTIIIDNLSQGHKAAVAPDAEFLQTDICDVSSLEKFFQSFQIDAVMHMAADTLIEHSMTDPARYFRNNVSGGINLLDTMLKHGVKKLVFSSTAAVYGEPEEVPIREASPKLPINAYGESKLMFEHVLRWYQHAYGLQHISLRYFNAAGASRNRGEDHRPETHLIPNVLKAAVQKTEPVKLFGTDYPTPDGTCVRDYVHVLDIGRAHLLALEKLDRLSGNVYNLGNGSGYSVMKVIQASRKATGIDIEFQACPRRSGDPAVLLADAGLARAELGWQPEFPELDDIVRSAWDWMQANPGGYRG